MKEVLKLALEALKTAQNNLASSKSSAHLFGDGELWDKYAEAITAIKEALAQPEPPPECQTEAEKTAFAFGWFKAMEAQRRVSEHLEPVAWWRLATDDGHQKYPVVSIEKPAPQWTTTRPLVFGDTSPPPVAEPQNT